MRPFAILVGLMGTVAAAQLVGRGGIGDIRSGAGPVTAPAVLLADGGFTAELRSIADGWDVRQAGDTVVLSRDIATLPMGAFSRADVQMQTYTVVVTVGPFVPDRDQRTRLEKERKAERAAWRTVEALQCDGKEFSDHYVDGFCFRPKTDAHERRIAAWRTARDRWLAVPRYHRGQDFSVGLRGGGIELADGPCRACTQLLDQIAARLTAYPTP